MKASLPTAACGPSFRHGGMRRESPKRPAFDHLGGDGLAPVHERSGVRTGARRYANGMLVPAVFCALEGLWAQKARLCTLEKLRLSAPGRRRKAGAQEAPPRLGPEAKRRKTLMGLRGMRLLPDQWGPATLEGGNG